MPDCAATISVKSPLQTSLAVGMPATSGLQYRRQFDLSMYDRIEVMRGPTGLLQGAGNPSGTVNLARKRTFNTFGASAGVLLGSWNNEYITVDVNTPLGSEHVRARVVSMASQKDFFYDTAHDERQMLYGIVEVDLGPRTTLALSATVPKPN